MEEEIQVQRLTVVRTPDNTDNLGLAYAPDAEVPGGPPPRGQFKALHNIQPLKSGLGKLREALDELIQLARLGHPRQGTRFEDAADAVARAVLPDCGLVGLIRPGFHPQFTTGAFENRLDVPGLIPWEMLDETYFLCNDPAHPSPVVLPERRHRGPGQPPRSRAVCIDGHAMERGGGRLALARHLTHVAHGARRAAPPAGKGFLVVADPHGDLCHRQYDKDGACERHLVDLKQALDRAGYDVTWLAGANATVTNVTDALRDESVVGVYYFGHGYFPHDGDQGCLDLADGPLAAGHVQELEPAPRFVFLNACYGAAGGQSWELEKQYSSAGPSFAGSGPSKVVAAALCPVVNVQAADAAAAFFAEAMGGARLGEALRAARAKSLRRFEQDQQPDISWLAYRYYGDPNQRLPRLPARDQEPPPARHASPLRVEWKDPDDPRPPQPPPGACAPARRRPAARVRRPRPAGQGRLLGQAGRRAGPGRQAPPHAGSAAGVRG